MRVLDILSAKESSTLYAARPSDPLLGAIALMSERDIGSVVIMEGEHLAGLLTFREVIRAVHAHPENLSGLTIQQVMLHTPTVCKPDMPLEMVRLLMLEHHARYLPVMDGAVLMGVISFYDVAKAIAETQDFENTALKAYIHHMPSA